MKKNSKGTCNCKNPRHDDGCETPQKLHDIIWEPSDFKLDNLVDDGTIYRNVGHVFNGDEDICLKLFGQQNEECIKHNAPRPNLNNSLGNK